MSRVETYCTNTTNVAASSNTSCDDLITCLITQRPVALSIARSIRIIENSTQVMPSCQRVFYCSARLVSRAWRNMEQEWATCMVYIGYGKVLFFKMFKKYSAIMRNIDYLYISSLGLNNGDVRKLQNTNIQSISLVGSCEITDVTPLAQYRWLKLIANHELRDVSALKHVHTLYLCQCENLTDVSALGGVYYLNLSECPNVHNVSALGKVHTLILSNCIGVSDVSALGTVHTLSIKHCRGVTNVSALAAVHALDLAHCKNVVDVSALGTVHMLILTACINIQNVCALNTVTWLSLADCDNIQVPFDPATALIGVAHLIDCNWRFYSHGIRVYDEPIGWRKVIKVFN